MGCTSTKHVAHVAGAAGHRTAPSAASDAHSGIWDTTFRDIEISGDEGRYLNVWGNLFDINWQSVTHVKGRFRNAELNNKTGVFEWFFEDDTCGTFTGRWKWDDEERWRKQPWTGRKRGVLVPRGASEACKKALEAAISKGVPLWNRGDYKGCTEIYKAVAEEYAAEDERLADALRQGRQAPWDSSSNSCGWSAWILRDAFDAVLRDTGKPKEVSKDRKACNDALQAAISKGVPLWNRGDYKGCTEIYKAVAEEYAAEDERLADALRRGRQAPWDSSSNSCGWILRHAFDAVLRDTGKPKEAFKVTKATSSKDVSPVIEQQGLEQASAAEMAAIQELFDKTLKKKRTRDRDGKLPTRFVVVQVQKNVSPSILSGYESVRAEVKARRTVDESTTFHAETHLERNLLSDRLELQCGEAYLFHGTNPEAVLSIAKHDFRLEVAGKNRGTMFGPGIYLAENSSKADEYAKDGESALYKGIFAMLLCRATLGKAYFVEAPGNYRSKVASGEYDCVVGDREKAVGTYREVVVFNAKQVFPEYAVLYRRELEDVSAAP